MKTSTRSNRVDETRDLRNKLEQLEDLVDELIKESPQEARIRSFMKAAGLQYSEDPIERMNSVLTALDGARSRGARKGGGHDRSL